LGKKKKRESPTPWGFGGGWGGSGGGSDQGIKHEIEEKNVAQRNRKPRFAFGVGFPNRVPGLGEKKKHKKRRGGGGETKNPQPPNPKLTFLVLVFVYQTFSGIDLI